MLGVNKGPHAAEQACLWVKRIQKQLYTAFPSLKDK